MIFRLEYKNKALKTARVDIITPTGTGVETVEGTGYPFMLKYEGDKKNKGLMFLSSSAEINIYETPLFNIDTLKTSGEKDIRVNYYIDSVLEWTGFVIPDFFSREIGGDGVVSMVASDRLSVLDSEVLEGLPVTVTLRTLLSLSLAKTGLTLPLKTVVDFATIAGGTNHILNHSIRSQRLTDTKGRSVNCKDIIKSILAATNSKLMQRKGAWWVVNKMQHELGGGRVYTSPTAFTNYVEDLISFTDVTRGAMRTIAPVAGGVGVFQEYGGGKLIPDNYNFKNGLTGWTNYNGFVSSTNNRRVLGYTQSGNIFTPIYDDAGTSEPYLVNRNISPIWVLFPPPSLGNIPVQWDPYAIRSTRIISPVISGDSNAAKVTVDINAVGLNNSFLPFSVVLKRPGRENLFLSRNSEWQPRAIAQLLSFKDEGADSLAAVSAGMSVSAVISAASSGEVLDDVGAYTIEVLIFGSGIQGDNAVGDNTTLINSASVQFSAASNDTPKGTLYKADQGGESYTKIHDTETTVFGDYLTGGLNGYFYNYAPDDTSSLLAPNGSRSQPAWVNTYTQNTEPLPLLQQTIRQMRRMFSVAHDFIKGEIDVSDFDPLSIFEDCERRFVIVEAEFDFLRGSLQVVLEEVAYQNLTVREYIYSYFGEGDEGIRGISGISAGSSGGGGGGGMAPEPSWLENEITIDPESGLLSVDGWHVKGDLIIEGQVNQWLAQQLVVDDARIQVNRKQDGVTVDSGLVIHDRDTGLEVSSLVYDVNGIWRAGGQRIFTEAYNPKLGGYSAGSYPRKAEDAVVTGAWTFSSNPMIRKANPAIEFADNVASIRARWLLFNQTMRLQVIDYATGSNIATPVIMSTEAPSASFNVISTGYVGFGIEPTERLHVAGNGLFTGAVTAGGNVGTSNFASQSQGWRVTPAGVADFRHIFTDELQAKAFTADISQALVGSDVLTKSVAKLAQNWATKADGVTSSIYVEELEGFPGYQVFAEGDRLLLRLFDRSGGGLLIKNIWATVANYVSTTNNVQRYLITVNSGGITGHTVYAGSMILDYGTSGSGVIERTVLDAMGSPYSQVKTWVNDPSNPANYTIHNRTGNLDGIANASGFGFYGENTFLTGKLLVGDLTKAGSYMEYAGGLLKVKGRVEAEEGLIGGMNIEDGAVGHNADNNKFIGMVSQTTSNAIIGGANSYLRRGFGMYHYDSATEPGGFKLMRMGMISNSDSANTFPSTPEYGFQIRLAATTNDVFRVDSTGAFIAGITFDDSKLSTLNWELNKDGSAMFAGGLIKMLADGDTTIGDVHVDAGGALVVKEGTDNRVLITKDDISTLAAIASSTQDTTVNNSVYTTYVTTAGQSTESQPNAITVNNNGTQLTVTGTFGLQLGTMAGQRNSQATLSAWVYLRKVGDGVGTGVLLSSGSVTVNKLTGVAMSDFFSNKSLNKVAIVAAGQYEIVADYTYSVTGPGPNEESYYNAVLNINATSMHALYDGAYQRNEIGKNGIGVIIDANNYSFFGKESGMYKAVEKVSNAIMYDKPGVLFAGNIASGGGLTAGYWGAKYRAGSYREGNNIYRIHHSVGHLNYYVHLTPHSDARMWVLSKETTYVRVQASLASLSFDFAITGNNQ